MSPLQLKLLDWVRPLLQEGLSPTLQQIADGLELSNKSRAHGLVASLIASGHLTRVPNKPRSLALAGVPDLRAAPSDFLRAELARRGEALVEPAGRRATGQQVTCAADTCGMAVQRGHLFCRRHWFALPHQLRDDLLRAHAARDTRRYQHLVAEARDIADACGGPL